MQLSTRTIIIYNLHVKIYLNPWKVANPIFARCICGKKNEIDNRVPTLDLFSSARPGVSVSGGNAMVT